jgi:hypothetical protein
VSRAGTRLGASLCGVTLFGCAVTPLTNKIAVGEDPFVIVVGEAPDGNTDLFAAPAGGGTFYRLTFNRPVERLPRIAPNGKAVAFVRSPDRGSAGAPELVVLDLTTMGEARGPVPEGRTVERLGWSTDGTRIAAAAGGELFDTPAPPAKTALAPVPADRSATADSATRERLGEPVFGLILDCGGEPCVVAGADTTRLGSGAADPIRWGPDSVAYRAGPRLEVRPLGGGRPRVPVWTDPPRELREPTHHPGAPRSAPR